MGNNIFEFDDKFGYKSPFVDWLTEQNTNPNLAKIISVRVEKIPNQPYANLVNPNRNKENYVVIPVIVKVEIYGKASRVSILGDGQVKIASKSFAQANSFEALFNVKVYKSLVNADQSNSYSFEFKITVTDSNSNIISDRNYFKTIIDTNGNISNSNGDSYPSQSEFKVCPIDPKYRSHFVLHCTAGNMTLSAIKEHTSFDSKNKLRSRAHVYIMKDGTTLQIWPFSEKNVWATKAETQKKLKGRMFHLEINYGAPDLPTKEQYETLANLYIEASNIEKCWPIIVPHIEIDRGLADGHGDPTDFDYKYFYSILKDKNIPIDDIPRFDHDRYWGKDSYKVPWANDKNSWPPVLKGNPHK